MNTQSQLLPAPSIQHRVKAFLARIEPLYPLLKSEGPVRHAALKRLYRLCARDFIATAKELLNSERYISLAMGLMAVTGRRPAEIFFSASFELTRKKLPFPALIFSGQLKTRFAPGTSFEPYPIPVLDAPKIVLDAFGRLRANSYLSRPAARPYRHQGRFK